MEALSPYEAACLVSDFSTEPRAATDFLFSYFYDELHRIATHQLARERHNHPLTPTELVHETYLKLAPQTRMYWNDGGHFLAVATQAMRRVLIDHARIERAAKRGGGRHTQPIEAAAHLATPANDDRQALDEALEHLASLHARWSLVVSCRYLAGLTIEETAAVLKVSTTTVKNEWRQARAWLHRALAA